jgi:adenylate kinase
MLVPDELAVRIIASWMDAHGSRFLFDGFPRTAGQAARLDDMLEGISERLDLVIFLDLPEREIRRRILDRLTCDKCGATYGATLHGFGVNDLCPQCTSSLVRRKDDTEEALAERLRVYREETLPVVEHYREKFPMIFHRVDAGEGSDAIFEKLSALVSSDQG